MMTLYYIGVDGSTQSTAIDPSRSWALQIARVYGFPCTVGNGDNSSSSGNNGFPVLAWLASCKALLRRVSFWVSAVDVLMFVVALACGGGFASASANPLVGPTLRGLSRAGGKYTYAIEVRNFMTSWKDKRLGPIAQLD